MACEPETFGLEARTVPEVNALHPSGDAEASGRLAQARASVYDGKLLRNGRIHMLILRMLSLIEREGRMMLGLLGGITRPYILLRLEMLLGACDGGLGGV